MTRNQKIFAGIENLCQVEEIPVELVVSGLEEALKIACRKHYNINDITVTFDMNSKRIKIVGSKEVVDKEVLGEAFDETCHIDINDIIDEKPKAKVGDKIIYKLKLEPENMERSTIASAKQVFRQNLRDAKYQKIKLLYEDKVGTVIEGSLEEEKNKFMYFKLPGNVEAVLPEMEQNPKDKLEAGKPISLYIKRLEERSKKGPKIVVSRKKNEIVSYELEKVVPEIQDGMITIKSVARDVGKRCKVAIELTTDEDIDFLGSVIGNNGSRINQVRKVLGGENIDIIEYFDDDVVYISNALSPALVTAVQILDADEHSCRVIVPDDQLSLAIGADGQNVRLASQLTKWKIDILSESDALEQGINYEDDII